jgi:hypothetical protein
VTLWAHIEKSESESECENTNEHLTFFSRTHNHTHTFLTAPGFELIRGYTFHGIDHAGKGIYLIMLKIPFEVPRYILSLYVSISSMFTFSNGISISTH